MKTADERFKAFVDELEALCIKHEATLSTSGYDTLQVWPFDGKPIHAPGIENELGR